MKGKYIFWFIFAIGIVISVVSGIAMFLPDADQELNEDVFFLVSPILAFMLCGRRLKESMDNNCDPQISAWSIYPLVLMLFWMIRSFYRLMFLLF